MIAKCTRPRNPSAHTCDAKPVWKLIRALRRRLYFNNKRRFLLERGHKFAPRAAQLCMMISLKVAQRNGRPTGRWCDLSSCERDTAAARYTAGRIIFRRRHDTRRQLGDKSGRGEASGASDLHVSGGYVWCRLPHQGLIPHLHDWISGTLAVRVLRAPAKLPRERHGNLFTPGHNMPACELLCSK